MEKKVFSAVVFVAVAAFYASVAVGQTPQGVKLTSLAMGTIKCTNQTIVSNSSITVPRNVPVSITLTNTNCQLDRTKSCKIVFNAFLGPFPFPYTMNINQSYCGTGADPSQYFCFTTLPTPMAATFKVINASATAYCLDSSAPVPVSGTSDFKNVTVTVSSDANCSSTSK